jgi:hypothetical protein
MNNEEVRIGRDQSPQNQQDTTVRAGHFQPFYRGILIGLGFLFTLGAGALVAVAVNSLTTYSTGQVLDATSLNTNFNNLKTAVEGIPTQPSMRLIFETDLTGTQDNVNVTGLNGNVDIEYQIIFRVTTPVTAFCAYGVRPNNISTSSYGYQYVGAGGTPTATAGRNTNETYLNFTTNNTAGQTAYANVFILAKTGVSRISHSLNVQQLTSASTTVGDNYYFSSVWNDSTTNITSLNFIGTSTNCYGAGSHIEVWARRWYIVK